MTNKEKLHNPCLNRFLYSFSDGFKTWIISKNFLFHRKQFQLCRKSMHKSLKVFSNNVQTNEFEIFTIDNYPCTIILKLVELALKQNKLWLNKFL